MGSAIILVAMLCVFFMRDVQLLATAHRGRFVKRLAVYGACHLIYLTSLVAILVSSDVYSPLRLFHTSPFWMMSLLWHCLIWLLCLRVSRRDSAALCWVAALFPTPVLLVSMATVTMLLPHSITSIGMVPLAAVVATCWLAAIAWAVSWVQRKPAYAIEAGFAVEFAGMTNATAMILIPMTEIVQGF